MSEEIDPNLKEEIIKLTISGETEALKSILEKDHSLFYIKDWTGDSLLAIACWQNKYDTAKMLVELGFDLDSTNKNGSTPLHRACYRKNIELVILLTNRGANYNLKDKSGRKPADVGDRIVRKVLLELERINEEDKERETMAQLELEEEREMALARAREEERMELVHKRQLKAVPIVVQGGRFHRVNGVYEPVDEIHQDWPVYSLRGDRDIWMVYVGDEWLIQSTKDKGTNKAYVRLKCETPTYPELRLEGNKGVIESTFSMVFGVPFQFSNQFESKLVILTEEEVAGIRASELFKFAERRNSDPMLPDSLKFMKHFSHSSNNSSTDANTPTRTNRSYSEDPDLFTNSTPLKYEEDALLEHKTPAKQQTKQKDLISLPSSSPSDILSSSPSSESTSFLLSDNATSHKDIDQLNESLLTVDNHDADHHIL